MDAWMTGLDSGEPMVGLWLLIWWMCCPPRTGSLTLPRWGPMLWLFMYAAGWCCYSQRERKRTIELMHVKRRRICDSRQRNVFFVVQRPRRVIMSLIIINDVRAKCYSFNFRVSFFVVLLLFTCACMPLWWPPRSPGGTHGSLGPPPAPKLGTVWNGLWSPYDGCPPTGVDAP